MYYRVKQFHPSYRNMFVIDFDTNLNRLRSRTIVEDCGKGGPRPFTNPRFLEPQDIRCTSLGGQFRPSAIIKE